MSRKRSRIESEKRALEMSIARSLMARHEDYITPDQAAILAAQRTALAVESELSRQGE